MKIQSFNQAKLRLQELSDGITEIRDFLDKADSAINAVNALKETPDTAQPKPSPKIQHRAPKSMADRVFKIFQDAGKPMTPKEVLAQYVSLGWPKDDDHRKFYTAISGTITYLTKRKKILIKSATGGYEVKPA